MTLPLGGHHLLALDVGHSNREACWSRFDVQSGLWREDRKKVGDLYYQMFVIMRRRFNKGSPLYRIRSTLITEIPAGSILWARRYILHDVYLSLYHAVPS